MPKIERSNKELKITAALYANRPGLVEHVKATGRLPDEIPTGGAEVGLRVIIQTRGTDIKLTPDEELVYDAIVRERHLRGGSAVLVEDERNRRKTNTNQKN